jgi:hypothetical protein
MRDCQLARERSEDGNARKFESERWSLVSDNPAGSGENLASRCRRAGSQTEAEQNVKKTKLPVDWRIGKKITIPGSATTEDVGRRPRQFVVAECIVTKNLSGPTKTTTSRRGKHLRCSSRFRNDQEVGRGS